QMAGGISAANLKTLELIEIWLIVSTMVLVSIYLLTMYYSSTAAREATRLMIKGNLAPLFIGGVAVAGLVVPLLLTIFAYSAGLDPAAASAILVVGGVLELGGGLMFRYTLLQAGVYNPIY
ncbi:MAG: polysulfide reductase NrfD, partial [Chloroflexi bacterium]|nr:polysulfide reductase NrfD [Chloroflexota bacterium]